MTDEQQDREDGFGDPTAEFLAAATRLAESVRPWLTAAMIEHAAHPDGAPGTCRLCAMSGAVGDHWDVLSVELAAEFAGFAERLRTDLQQLLEELFGTVSAALSVVLADYDGRVNRAPSTDADPEQPAADPTAAPRAGGQAGFQRIDIHLENP